MGKEMQSLAAMNAYVTIDFREEMVKLWRYEKLKVWRCFRSLLDDIWNVINFMYKQEFFL